MSYLYAVLAIAAAYFAGAVPFALIVGRIVGRIDIRRHGSGNIGATNAGRLLGRTWGSLVFVLDFAKGFVPVVLVAGLLEPALAFTDAGRAAVGVLAGLAAIVGHTFPMYLGFKGGKGVATSSGVFAALHWPTMLCAAAVWAAMVLATRYVSLASITAAVVLPVVHAFFLRDAVPGAGLPVFAACLAVALLIIWRHRANILRLCAGTERKVGAPLPEDVPPGPTTLKG